MCVPGFDPGSPHFPSLVYVLTTRPIAKQKINVFSLLILKMASFLFTLFHDFYNLQMGK